MFPANTKIIITTSPTGLGHIRVTKALIDGLPAETTPEVVGNNDTAISVKYRLISTNVYLRKAFEFIQTNPFAEKMLDKATNLFLNADLKELTQKLSAITSQHKDKQVPFIIVSTHGFVAEKVQAIIERKLLDRPVFHAVIVTDDSPQRFWMINANILFVPSYKTKQKLEELFKKDNKEPPYIAVNPYPINPNYSQKLADHVLYNKIEQLDPDNPQRARICIPVSGAAVQLDYYQTLIEELLCEDTKTQLCHEFSFSVVTREGNYTRPFIDHFREHPHVLFHIGASDEHTVELYDELYDQLNPPALEITKPSEQCFKVLTSPDTKGGPILLLTEPVGRQEYDNLNYLERFGFLPSEATHQELYSILCNSKTNNLTDEILSKSQTWRALKLPIDPLQASQFIVKCFLAGIFKNMQQYKGYTQTEEISPDGVKMIWEKIENKVSEGSQST